MVWVDIAIIALLVIYSTIGLLRGYSQEVYAIFVWIIGALIAWFFCQDFALLLLKFFGKSTTRLAVSFVALVIITLFLGSLINMLLTESVKKSGLGLLDRVGGLALGFFQGMVVTIVFVVVAGLTYMPKDRWWRESKYLPPFQSCAILIKDNLSTKLASSINYR